ncbi:peroxisomal sarcosine oxidase, partial [Plakobranchus ocellatus]
NCGVLDIRDRTASAQEVVSALSAYDIPHEHLLTRDIRRRFPMFNVSDKDQAIYDPNGGLIRADTALAAFQKMFKQFGGTLHDKELVRSVKPGSPAKVVTSCSIYAASSVVIAAGPWTGKFASELGLSLRLKPIKVTPMYWRIKPGQEEAHQPDKLLATEELPVTPTTEIS